MSEYNVELLAPAGSIEAFLGAIHAGADAVYLAGEKYGARAYAENFKEEDLLYCIRYAHIHGKKVYLTVNTLFKEEELKEVYAYILPLYEQGLDACIVQDIGVFQYLRECFPDMELHVSTQMNITGEYGAGLLKEMGATRIVPARELNLNEIRQMKEKTGLELETFIHGAMCYCYSGQCLYSSLLGGRSGNRGRCAQPCRLPYKVKLDRKETQECYPFSLKDMCTIEYLDELMDAGIDSFKIEGRMKKPEYAAGVTAIYRKYIDLKYKYPNKKLHISKEDLQTLSKLYIRSEIQSGYYFKQNGAEMITMTNPAYSGSDDALLKEIRRKYIEEKPLFPISVSVCMKCNEGASVNLKYQDISVTVKEEIVSIAQKAPLTKESIQKQFSKLGDTCFAAKDIKITTDGKSFCTIKDMNSLRRKAIRLLEDAIIKKHGLIAWREQKKGCAIEQTNEGMQVEKSDMQNQWTVLVSTKAQLNALERFIKTGDLKLTRLYIESELILSGDVFENYGCQNRYIALPYCMRAKDKEKINKVIEYSGQHGYKGFMVRNLEEYAYLKAYGYQGEIISDAGIYIWNSKALEFWSRRVNQITCSYELKRKEYQTLLRNVSYEKLIYGHLPMMITANCIAKSTGKCLSQNGVRTGNVIDRYKKQLPVKIDCIYCMNIIYNSQPLSLHKDLGLNWNDCQKRIMFTVEGEEETYNILMFYSKIEKGMDEIMPFKEYTTGHEKRGVE